MALMTSPMLGFVLLAAGVALCASAATVAALAGRVRLAAVGLSLTAVLIAAMALLHFGEPLAAAAVLITQGVVVAVVARSASENDPAPLRGRWWLLVIAAFAGVLLFALAPVASPSPATATFSPYDAFLLSVCTLAALAVALGVHALWRDGDDEASR